MRIRIMTEALKNECAGRLMFDLAARCDFSKVCIGKRGKRAQSLQDSELAVVHYASFMTKGDSV